MFRAPGRVHDFAPSLRGYTSVPKHTETTSTTYLCGFEEPSIPDSRETLLGGSWVVISGVISKATFATIGDL